MVELHTFSTVSIIPTIQLTKVRGDFRGVICWRSGIILRRLLFVDLAQTVVNDVTDVILGPTGVSRQLQNPTTIKLYTRRYWSLCNEFKVISIIQHTLKSSAQLSI